MPGATGTTVLGATVTAFAAIAEINPIVITVPAGEEHAARSCLPEELLDTRKTKSSVLFVAGGPTRRASVHNALSLLLTYNPTYVLIHDGARPWIKRGLIERCIEAAKQFGAAIPVLPLLETPKEIDLMETGRFIKRRLERSAIYTAQTPQCFAFPEILTCHEKAAQETNHEYTDDAEVWTEFAGKVAAIPGNPGNRKITYPEDLEVWNEDHPLFPSPQSLKIGIGRDIHRLVAGRKFLLGGVTIPFEKGEDGHSDGDALSHAICDALLGAAGLSDIGALFPPDDPEWRDAHSLNLLKRTWRLVNSQGWRLVNLDCTVTCENPRIAPHRDHIRRTLAAALDADPRQVFVKGKTNEGLGPIGAGEAIEALAVCLLSGIRAKGE